MIGAFSRTRERETREVQPEECLQREAAQAKRQDDFVRLQARDKGKARVEDEALKPKLVGEDGRPRKKEVVLTDTTGFIDGTKEAAKEYSNNFSDKQKDKEQMQAVTGGVLPEPKESVSPIAFNRMMADKLFTKADLASQRGYTSLAETIRENAMKHDEHADQLEADERRERNRPKVKEKRQIDKFVKVLEKVIDCVSCNVEIPSPRGEPNPDQVRYRQMTENLAEQHYPEEWKNHPEYIREQEKKNL